MKFKATLFLLLILLIALPALAEKSAITPLTDDMSVQRISPFNGSAYFGRDLFEGFEGEFPPAGWTLTTTNTAETWGQQADGWSIEGTYSARMWRDMENPQDETLSFEHTVDVAGGEYILSFWMAGASGQTWDFGSAETVEINGVEVFNFDDEVAYGHHLYFEKYFVDLSDWDGETVTIAFRYVGIDGGSLFVDAVMIDNGVGFEPDWPPAQPNDTCESALENGYFIPSGNFVIEADNTEARRDYALTWQSCVYYGFTGFDLVWIVCMEQGDVLNVSMSANPWYDEVFWLCTDCSDPVGTCVAMGDEPPNMNFTSPSDETYYLIAGGWSYGNVGPFTLTGNLVGAGCDLTATDDSTWSEVKSLYR